MKIPPFDREKMMWDYHREFYIGHGALYDHLREHAPFKQFETGDLVCAWYEGHFNPENRKSYFDGSVTVVATTDDKCPPLYRPGETTPITRSHLSRGGLQALLIDHDFDVAVRIAVYGSTPVRKLPREYSVYYGTADARPVASRDIEIGEPRKYTKDEKAQMQITLNACKAWYQMLGDDGLKAITSQDQHWPNAVRYDGHEKLAGAPQPATILLKPFAELNAAQRISIATRGTSTAYMTTGYPYLVTKAGGS